MGEIRRVDRLEALTDPPTGADFVIVDVILASTTIVRLLELEVASITPVGTPDAARDVAAELDDPVLVGEQGGMPIDGFDYPPIPTVLADADLAGRPIVLVTSNGTRAIDHVRNHGTPFVASATNAGAVAEILAERDRDVTLIAAGRRGSPTPEDIAGVDLVESALRGTRSEAVVDRAREAIRTSPTAEWLAASGFERDIDRMLSVDSSAVVPQLSDGRLVPTER